MTHRNLHRVVILGGGYAGVRVAWNLAQQTRRTREFEIVLVSNSRWHLEKPALYEVATAFLERESLLSTDRIREAVSVPLQAIFAGLPVKLRYGWVERLLPGERLVQLREGVQISYDTLVLALGARAATYGVPGVAAHAFPVDTLANALALRHRIVRSFKQAATMKEASAARTLTFVVVGGGVTGVETAAELAVCAQRECERHNIDRSLVQIVLAEAGKTILSTLPESFQQQARERLHALGVRIRTGSVATEVTPSSIEFNSQERVATETVVWAGGLCRDSLLATSGLPLADWGVATTPTLQVVDNPTLYAAGDVARIQGGREQVPATVPVAYQQGALVAENISRQRHGLTLRPYTYAGSGALIAVGRKEAILLLANNMGWVGMIPWVLKRLVALRYWIRYLPLGTAARFWWDSVRLHVRND